LKEIIEKTLRKRFPAFPADSIEYHTESIIVYALTYILKYGTTLNIKYDDKCQIRNYSDLLL
jgi:hypothetical protein